MPVLYTNNAASTIASSISNATTSISVASGAGSLFPVISGGDYFYATLTDNAANIEIVKVTARSTDTLTVVRGQEGTSARSWSVGDKIELRITKAMLDDFKSDTRVGISSSNVTNALGYTPPGSDGSGASGTWGINVTGSAGSINATQPNIGYSASALDMGYAGQGGPQVQSQGDGAAMMSFHRPGAYAVNFGLDTDNVLKIGGWSFGDGVKHTILHSGNYTSYVDVTSTNTVTMSNKTLTTPVISGTSLVDGALGWTGTLMIIGIGGTTYQRIVTDSNSTTLTNKNIDNPTVRGYTESTAVLNSSTAHTIDIASKTLYILTLTANCTLTFPTATSGKSFMLLLKQGSTGPFTATWPASVKWPGGTAPTLTAIANKGDKFVFTADGTNWWGSVAGQNYTL